MRNPIFPKRLTDRRRVELGVQNDAAAGQGAANQNRESSDMEEGHA